MILFEIDADVTKSLPEYVTVQCISEDCAMGAGVVLAFRKVFPGLKDACKAYIASEPVRVGKNMIPMPYRHTDASGVLYNMFTKQKVWFKAGKGMDYQDYLNNLEVSLTQVKELMIKNSEQKLAMPKIGCGLDQCEWDDVKLIIISVFDDSEIEVVICNYEPDKNSLNI